MLKDRLTAAVHMVSVGNAVTYSAITAASAGAIVWPASSSTAIFSRSLRRWRRPSAMCSSARWGTRRPVRARRIGKAMTALTLIQTLDAAVPGLGTMIPLLSTGLVAAVCLVLRRRTATKTQPAPATLHETSQAH